MVLIDHELKRFGTCLVKRGLQLCVRLKGLTLPDADASQQPHHGKIPIQNDLLRDHLVDVLVDLPVQHGRHLEQLPIEVDELHLPGGFSAFASG